MTYDELEALLFARARAGMKLGLDRMERALDALGRPDRATPVVHVAGTNGKGSTCAFLERAFREAGLRTALYTSPHLERFGERFRFDGEPLGEREILRHFDSLASRAPIADLTFFELVTLLGFVAIAERRVDVAVVEVGLGGRFDATNVVVPRVACITPIGLDHREYLGDTLAKIAWEKAGIIKPGVPVVSARQEPEAAEVIESVARDLGAPLFVEGRDFALPADVAIGLRGAHQRSNAAVAWQALELSGFRISDDARRRALALATWPGRLETVRREPEVVLDGAHNPHATRALARSVRELFSRRRVELVLGVLADKDASEMLDDLLPIADRIVATQPSSPRAVRAEALADLIRARGREVESISDPTHAVDVAIARARGDDVVLVCGSLYLVGEVRAHLRGTRASGPSETVR